MHGIAVHSLGLVEYQDGLQLQKLFGEARAREMIPDSLLLLEHPPVLTLGRAGKRENILASTNQLADLGVEIFETDRGGDVTYHGPGQIVGYPIFLLPPDRRDVRRYVRDLEESLIRALQKFGIDGARLSQWPGVWIGKEPATMQKIAAIGVHISRWQTSHGLALNVNPDLSKFGLIVPCGIADRGVTSMEQVLGHSVELESVIGVLASAFESVFQAKLVRSPVPQRSVSVCLITEERPARVLLLRRRANRGGFWQIITGCVEDGEEAQAAAVRELAEETGILGRVSDLEYRHSFALGSELPPRVVQETAYVARVADGTTVRLDTIEHDEHAWVSVEQALEMLPFAGLKRAVQLSARLRS